MLLTFLKRKNGSENYLSFSKKKAFLQRKAFRYIELYYSLFRITYSPGFPDNCNFYLSRISHFILDAF